MAIKGAWPVDSSFMNLLKLSTGLVVAVAFKSMSESLGTSAMTFISHEFHLIENGESLPKIPFWVKKLTQCVVCVQPSWFAESIV